MIKQRTDISFDLEVISVCFYGSSAHYTDKNGDSVVVRGISKLALFSELARIIPSLANDEMDLSERRAFDRLCEQIKKAVPTEEKEKALSV
jgi:hypothetical protein